MVRAMQAPSGAHRRRCSLLSLLLLVVLSFPSTPVTAATTWVEEPWSACDPACGAATRTRAVWCSDSTGQLLADSDCSATPKPITQETCLIVRCLEWAYGNYGECSRCQAGTRTRSVWCRDTASGATVADSECLSSPVAGVPQATSEDCNVYPCTNNRLAWLNISDSYGWKFNPDQTNYQSSNFARVGSEVTSVTADAAVQDSTARIEWGTSRTLSGLIYPNAAMFQVKVIAQNNDQRIYNVDVRRDASSNAWLASITITTPSIGVLRPSFAPTTTEYTVVLPLAPIAISLAATSADARAQPFNFIPSNSIQPLSSSNRHTIEIRTTAQDMSTKTYTIVVVRSNSFLSTLEVQNSFGWSFTPTTETYLTVYVPFAQTSATATATPLDSAATITWDPEDTVTNLGLEMTKTIQCTVWPPVSTGAQPRVYTLHISRSVQLDLRSTQIVGRDVAGSGAELAGLSLQPPATSPVDYIYALPYPSRFFDLRLFHASAATTFVLKWGIAQWTPNFSETSQPNQGPDADDAPFVTRISNVLINFDLATSFVLTSSTDGDLNVQVTVVPARRVQFTGVPTPSWQMQPGSTSAPIFVEVTAPPGPDRGVLATFSLVDVATGGGSTTIGSMLVFHGSTHNFTVTAPATTGSDRQMRLRTRVTGEGALFFEQPDDVPLTVMAGSMVVSNPVVSVKRSPNQPLTVGQAVTLKAQVERLHARTDADDLVFEWSSTSHPQLLANQSVLVNESSLSLPVGALAQPGTYSFAVRVADSNTAHSNAQGGPPSTTVSASVFVTAAVEMDVNVTTPDPCATQSPCVNGGRCVATLQSAEVYRLSCQCPTAPFAFFGPTCAFALLACPNCVSQYVGGSMLTLFGLGLGGVMEVRVAGRLAEFQPAEWRGAEDAQAADVLRSVQKSHPGVTRVQALRVLTPALVSIANHTANISDSSTGGSASVFSALGDYPRSGATRDLLSLNSQHGFHSELRLSTDEPSAADPSAPAPLVNPISAYQQLSVVAALPGSTAPLQFNFSSLIFYSSQQCVAAGVWRDDGLGGCLPCPQGGYCPGGGRVWPLPGYWSVSEYHSPVSCPIPEACVGVDIAAPTGSKIGAELTDTQQCAAEYAGPQCVQCAEGHYMLQGRCYFCGASTDQTRDIALTLAVAVAAMCLLAVAAALLTAAHLSVLTQLFTTLQSVAMVGVEGARNIPVARKELSATFTYLNFINADIEILRPGCAGIPDFDWAMKLWVTLLFLLVVAILFLVACLVRLCVLVHLAHRRSEKLLHQSGHGSTHVPLDGVGAASLNDSGRAALAPPSNAPLSDRFRHLRSTPEWTDFRWRLQHCLLILGCIFYLRLCTLFFRGFRCVMADDPLTSTASDAVRTQSLYLAEDLQTRCWTADHMEAMGVVILLLALYVVGLPVACFVLLMRNFADADTPGVLGWMWSRFSILRGPDCSDTGTDGLGKGKNVGPTRLPSPTAKARLSDGSDSGAGAVAAASNSPPVPHHHHAPSSSSSGSVDWTIAGVEIGVTSFSDPTKQHQLAKPTASAKQRSSSTSEATALSPAAQALSESRSARFGYLFYSLRPTCFAFFLTTFVMHVWVAAVTVFVADTDPRLKLFLFGLAWASLTALTATELPYQTFGKNVRKVLIGFASLAHSTLLLGVQSGGVRSSYFSLLLVIFMLLVLALLVRKQAPLWFERCMAFCTNRPAHSAQRLDCEAELQQLDVPTNLHSDAPHSQPAPPAARPAAAAPAAESGISAAAAFGAGSAARATAPAPPPPPPPPARPAGGAANSAPIRRYPPPPPLPIKIKAQPPTLPRGAPPPPPPASHAIQLAPLPPPAD